MTRRRYKLLRRYPPGGTKHHASREAAEATLRSELPDSTITRAARGRYVDQDGTHVASIRVDSAGEGGRYANPRRQLTATAEQFAAMDAEAAADGLPWSQWVLGLGLAEVERRKRTAGRKRQDPPK